MPLAALPLTGAGKNLTGLGAAVRDIWDHADLASLGKSDASLKLSVPGMDSAFVRLH